MRTGLRQYRHVNSRREIELVEASSFLEYSLKQKSNETESSWIPDMYVQPYQYQKRASLWAFFETTQ